jgi:hypothetical protein
VNIAGFRTNFPEFSDDTKYPTTEIEFWADSVAVNIIDASRWGNSYSAGLQLIVAHYLVLQNLDKKAATTGGVTTGGVIASKAVGSVNVSYDNSVGAVDGAGDWMRTSYGRRFYNLSRLFGAGAVQL